MISTVPLSKTTQYIPVVCAADDNYAMPLAVTARSILENLGEDKKLLLFVIDGGIKEHNKQKIINSLDANRCDVKWLHPSTDELLKKMKISGHISVVAYYRFLIPEIISSEFEKVIYLDCDLVVNHDLSELWELDLKDNYLLAVPEIRFPYLFQILPNFDKLGISSDCKYFNSGVLLINLQKWRKDQIGLKAIQYVEQNIEYIVFHDQDALNVVLAKQWGELEPKWNQTPFIYDYSTWKDSPFQEEAFNDAVNDPCIIHFASKHKPWNTYQYRERDQKLFYKYLDMTAWAGMRFTLWMAIYKKLMRIILRNNKR
ncbi:MAG: glycosyltransferase family 8 protein [Richelia sp. RM2_1_2]|nr:glycosyltransferase family 8 protein [Richelia sp. RM2_1_2]